MYQGSLLLHNWNPKYAWSKDPFKIPISGGIQKEQKRKDKTCCLRTTLDNTYSDSSCIKISVSVWKWLNIISETFDFGNLKITYDTDCLILQGWSRIQLPNNFLNYSANNLRLWGHPKYKVSKHEKSKAKKTKLRSSTTNKESVIRIDLQLVIILQSKTKSPQY